MRYISTRGEAPELGFTDVTLAGLARDGGLYVPAEWPLLDAAAIAAMRTASYENVAFTVIRPYVAAEMDDATLKALLAKAYSTFTHKAIAPLSQIGPNDWLLELFHGPTCAFKDFALQFLGQAFDWALAKTGKRITIVGATSGDTGSAAIEAVRDRSNVRIFMLHPEGRVSDVQRRQMTTVTSANVVNVAVEGTFDDCQALVKALFNDHAFRDEQCLSAVNSINWVRVMAQVVYYFYAGSRLGAPESPVAFAVPTGNFGDVFAGYVASRMGLPIERLVVATNSNDILARTLNSGEYTVTGVTPTISPAMDIQVSSNFERLLFDICDRDGSRVRAAMASLAQSGSFTVEPAALAKAREKMDGERVDEAETVAALKAVYTETGRLLDPHTAVGIAAAKRLRGGIKAPLVTLSTAHAAKFPDPVRAATGLEPVQPAALARLAGLPERCATLANDADALKAMIRGTAW